MEDLNGNTISFDSEGNEYKTYTGLDGQQHTYDRRGNRYDTYEGLDGLQHTYSQDGDEYVSYEALDGTTRTYKTRSSKTNDPSSVGKSSYYSGGYYGRTTPRMKECARAKVLIYVLYGVLAVYALLAFSMDFGFGILACGAAGLSLWWTNYADILINFSDVFVFGISWLLFLYFSCMSATLRVDLSMRIILFILLAAIGILQVMIIVSCVKQYKNNNR